MGMHARRIQDSEKAAAPAHASRVDSLTRVPTRVLTRVPTRAARRETGAGVRDPPPGSSAGAATTARPRRPLPPARRRGCTGL